MRVGLFSVPRLVHGGGFEEYLIGLAKGLTARGHDVAVVTASARAYRALNIALNVYYGNAPLRRVQRVSDAELRERLTPAELHEVSIASMARVLGSCDVLYVKNEVLDLAALSALRVCRGFPPVVCGVHTPMWFPRAPTRQARLHNALYLGRVYRSLLRSVDVVHVSNSNDAQLFPQSFGWPAERLYQIPYPYDLPSPPTPRAPLGPVRVLWAARLTQQKGVDVLASVVGRALEAAPGAFVFTIAGSGDDAETAVVERLATNSDVQYVGHASHERMDELYRCADVCLVTSNWETFPYSCLEPQARGIPVVAPRIPGCLDIVEDDVTGFLFAPGDPSEAFAQLQRVRSMATDDYLKIATRSRKRVEEKFSSDRVFGRLVDMILETQNLRV